MKTYVAWLQAQHVQLWRDGVRRDWAAVTRQAHQERRRHGVAGRARRRART